jgi:hypothetical protein
MVSNRVAFAALAVACIAAATGGGYLASRHNAAAPAALNAPSSPSASARRGSVDAVQETEALVNQGGTLAELPEQASKSSASPRKRAESAEKPAAKVPADPASSRSAASPNPLPAADPLPSTDHPAPGTVAPPQIATSTGAALPPPIPVPEAQLPAPKPEEHSAPEVTRLPDPPQKTFEDLVVPADSVIGLQSQTTVVSDRARVEDRVEARVTRDVRVHNAVAIPAGAQALGSVVSVDRGGRFKDRARLGIRFNTIVLADGSRLPISTETIYRDGEPPGKESAAKVGGATVGGAILGAIFGGGKGAAIGAAAGAGAGSATVMASERNNASLRSGEPITVRILSPVSVTVEQK